MAGFEMTLVDLSGLGAASDDVQPTGDGYGCTGWGCGYDCGGRTCYWYAGGLTGGNYCGGTGCGVECPWT